jgi:DNA polymerase (family 10)
MGMDVTNEDIAALMDDLGALLKTKGDSIFKIRAYERAARTIRQLDFSLEQAVEDGMNLKTIPGIGDAISRKIKEMVTTGKVGTYERLKEELLSS